MPLTKSGKKVMANMKEEYGEDKGENVFFASKNKGIPGSDKWEKKAGKSTPAHPGHDRSHRQGKH